MRIPVNSAGARADAAASRPTLPLARVLARVGRRLQAEDGFTIVEVIVATMVLVVGLLTAFLALNLAVKSSADVRGREEGITLARQITEDARSIPYSQLSSSSVLTTTLQGFDNLANQGSGSSWQITRGGFTYTITMTLTPIYDKKDSANTSSNTSVDAQEVTAQVQWNTQTQTHTYSESTIITKAGQDPGLSTSNLVLSSPVSGTGGLSGSASAGYQITSTGITSLTFGVTAPSGTQAIDWYLNGALQSSWAGSTPTSGTTWTSSAWNISSVYDNTYTIGARAVDSSGVAGPMITIQVRLIRNVPSAPSLTYYGYNTNLLATSGSSTTSTGAELQWSANPEPNVVGYGIYNNGGTLVCQTGTSTSYTTSCDTNGGNFWCLNAIDCIDLSANASSAATYKVRALYYDANNTLQAGTATQVTINAGTPAAPNSPATLTISTQLDETAILTWPVSVGGASVAFYRVYRDGDNYGNRYATVAASSCSVTCSYHDYNRAEGHSYYVTAVTSAEQESNPPVGPASG